MYIPPIKLVEFIQSIEKVISFFYLRLLLVNVRGPTSFQHLRTVKGELYGSHREACQRLQLLENHEHWDQTLNQ